MSNILRRSFVQREEFDPTNPAHIKSLENFVQTGTWGDIQFCAELPYIEVPITVLMKYVQYSLSVSPETSEMRSARLAANPNLIPDPRRNSTINKSTV